MVRATSARLPDPFVCQCAEPWAGGSAQCRAGRGRGGQADAARPAGWRNHAEGTSREFMVWAAMPPDTWIWLPRFFASELPPRGPVELWLQHAGCRSLATGAEVEVVPLETSS